MVAEHPAALPGSPVAGETTISEAAVARVAAAAARTVAGVHALGSGAGRALGALRGRVTGAVPNESTAGITAEVGREEVAVDVVLTAEYDRPLQDIAADVRAAIYSSVEELTGLRVIEVNVEIGDIHVAPAPAEPATPEPTGFAEPTGLAAPSESDAVAPAPASSSSSDTESAHKGENA